MRPLLQARQDLTWERAGEGRVEASMLEHSWRAEYEGHELRIENHIACERLYTDGRLTDERRGWLPPKRPLTAAIASEDGTSSVVHAYVVPQAVSSDCQVWVYRRFAAGDVIDEQLPVETEKDAALFAKVFWSLWLGLLLFDLPEALQNMIRAGVPVYQMAFRMITGVAIWMLLGMGFIRLMGKLDARRPAPQPTRTDPDKREGLQAEPQGATRTTAEEPTPFQSWVVQRASDGKLRVQRKAEWYRPRVIVCLVFVLLNAGLFAVVLFVPGMPGRDQEIARWGCITLVSVGFVYFLALLLRYALEREEWRVGPNFLEVRKRFLYWGWNRRYRNASLTMTSRGPVLQIIIEMSGRKRVLAFSPVSGPAAEDPEEFRALARLLTTHAGWPPPYICPACGGAGHEVPEDEPCQTCEGRGRVTWEELADWIRRRAVE